MVARQVIAADFGMALGNLPKAWCRPPKTLLDDPRHRFHLPDHTFYTNCLLHSESS